MNLEDLRRQMDAAKAEQARRSFHRFLVDYAWPVLQPGVEFRDNWHIHAICEHLEAIKSGEIKKLVVNMPFRQLKSTIISQAFMAWDWIDDPQMQYLTASYAKDLSTRDAVASRRIVESDSYQRSFGDKFKMTTDQNVKTRYENDKGGGRVSTSTDAAAIGFGGNRRFVDDPANPRQADSAAHVQASVDWWKGSFSTRANDPVNDAVVLVQQRLNENDTTGYVLKNETGWVHLVLPMRYEAKYTKTTVLGFKDPRTKEGELMFPSRLPEKEVVDLETNLGAYHVNAQMQQRPEPRGGVIFDRNNWKYWTVKTEYDEVVISVDCSFKDLQTSDRVGIHVWGCRGSSNFLLHRIWERLSFTKTCETLLGVVALFPEAIAKLIEDKANGTAVINSLSSHIGGVIPVNPQGGKAARAYAMQPDHEAGNFYLPHPSIDPKIEVFVGCAASFTGAEGGEDDEVDAMTQFAAWRKARVNTQGLHDWMRAQAEAAEAARKLQNQINGRRN